MKWLLLGGMIGFLRGVLLMAVGRGPDAKYARATVLLGDAAKMRLTIAHAPGTPLDVLPCSQPPPRIEAPDAQIQRLRRNAEVHGLDTAPAGAGVTACRSPSSDTPRWSASALSAGHSPPRGYRYPR